MRVNHAPQPGPAVRADDDQIAVPLLSLLVKGVGRFTAGEPDRTNTVTGAHLDQFALLGRDERMIISRKGVHDVDLFRIHQLSGPIKDRRCAFAVEIQPDRCVMKYVHARILQTCYSESNKLIRRVERSVWNNPDSYNQLRKYKKHFLLKNLINSFEYRRLMRRASRSNSSAHRLRCHETADLLGDQARELDGAVVAVRCADGLQADGQPVASRARGKHRARQVSVADHARPE